MNDVEIFTGPGCAYCEAAKDLLRQNDVPFTERDVSDADVLAVFQESLPRVRSIPQVFADGEHIGGLDDLKLRLA